MGKKGWAVVGGAVAIVVGFFAWSWFLSPEARVERVIRAAAAAAENVDAAEFLSFFSADYSDYLHGNRDIFDERVESGFTRVDRLNVNLQAVDVEVDDDAAAVRFEVSVVAFRGDDRFLAVGTPLQPELVTAELERGPSGWKLVRVDRRFPEE